MNLPTPRKSRAQRAYENLRLAAGNISTLYEYELERIARAINPKAEEFRFRIFDHHVWLVDKTTFTDCLTSGWSSSYYRLRTRLAYFRAEVAEESSSQCVHDVRLVCEFQNEKGFSVWLDAETGLPWRPAKDPIYYKAVLPEVRAESERRHNEETAAARKVLAEIEKEKCSSLMWQEDYQLTTETQRVQRLEFSTRPNTRKEFGEPQILAWKYFPSKSVTYPEHVPNASLLHEVAA